MIKYFILQHPTENKPEYIPFPKDLSDWWKDCQSQVGALLRAKKLFKCLISDPEPDIKDKYLWDTYDKKNDEAFGIIITTLSDQQAGMFLDVTKAKKVWDDLKRIYTGNLEDKIIDVGLELKNIKMNHSESVDQYLTRAKNIGAKSSSLGHQISQRELTYHIVRGIHPKLEKMAIVLRSRRDITLEEIQQSLKEEENRLYYKMNEIPTEEQEQAYRSRNRRGYHPDKLKKCFICVKKGHVAKDCWFRNKRSQEQQRNRNAKSSTNHHKSNFRNRTNQISSTPKEVAFNSYIDEGSDVSTDSNGEKRSLCVDSGCTTHLSPHLDWMEDVVPYEREIDLAEKDKITNSTAKGNIGMTTSTGQEFSIVQIRDVLHVPNLRSNLLSVCELTKRGNTIIFNNEGAKIFNKENNLIAEAQIKDRMFITEAGLRIDNSRKPDNAMATSNTSNDKISIWHRRLNHLNQAYMKEMTQGNLVYGHDIKYRNLPECDSCIMGKLSSEPYNPVTRNNTTEPLELIHMDLCGPMANKSLGGSRYFFVLVDDFSKRTFVYFLKTKDETFDRFRYFKARVENELNLKIKDVRTDNGTEFINDKFKGFLIKNGIHHQLTTTYSPQSNGVAERINRPLVETARTLLIDSMLPMPFWAEAGATAAYVKNCTPHKSLRHATPMEKWKGRKPSIRHLRIFGCLVYWPTNKRRRNKFSPKSQKGIFIGYSLSRKA
ncbi:hypothetical protein LAZ67_11002829 [Cordylochernes scorpioides]|uniref:Retrovirus-related Pol polyprotein from transposon TNT 1-94 n=1 Tax=Cordylochernes scorpioides TaxID=51811 RepID=A0ABY6L4C0_9ARAC|nr:hypothetical protein LAZ67_11002829 [Cordylochernes scorpioides]